MKHARKDYDRTQDPEGLIPDDEPVFLLRGQDVFAADIVRLWAGMVEDVNPGIAKMAREHADLMDAWPHKKEPDAPGDDHA